MANRFSFRQNNYLRPSYSKNGFYWIRTKL